MTSDTFNIIINTQSEIRKQITRFRDNLSKLELGESEKDSGRNIPLLKIIENMKAIDYSLEPAILHITESLKQESILMYWFESDEWKWRKHCGEGIKLLRGINYENFGGELENPEWKSEIKFLDNIYTIHFQNLVGMPIEISSAIGLWVIHRASAIEIMVIWWGYIYGKRYQPTENSEQHTNYWGEQLVEWFMEKLNLYKKDKKGSKRKSERRLALQSVLNESIRNPGNRQLNDICTLLFLNITDKNSPYKNWYEWISSLRNEFIHGWKLNGALWQLRSNQLPKNNELYFNRPKRSNLKITDTISIIDLLTDSKQDFEHFASMTFEALSDSSFWDDYLTDLSNNTLI